MPPGPVFNWFSVAYSAVQILEHAAQYRAAQLTRSGAATAGKKRRKVEDIDEELVQVELGVDENASSMRYDVHPRQPSSSHRANEDWLKQIAISPLPFLPSSLNAQHTQRTEKPALHPVADLPPFPDAFDASASPPAPETTPLPIRPSKPFPLDPLLLNPISPDTAVEAPIARTLQSSRVPSSRIGRLFHYGGLATSLGYGAASELLRRSTTTSGSSTPIMLTEVNISRLVSKLSQMRGAALKVGQFLSIQDTHLLPPEVDKIFRRVQDGAHYMPNWQMEKVMETSLGPTWRTNFASFDPVPFAAASIGQVHRGVLAAHASPTGAEARVAIKVQFPNIRQSVETDIGYLKTLLTAGRLLPRGLFLDKTIAAMKEELADECDYTREAGFLREFADGEHLGADYRFKVPWVWDGSTERVLVMEYVDGVSVGGDAVNKLSQEDKDEIAARIIELCLRELFVFRAMQTDPNFTNFLWDAPTRRLTLVDFGATRVYPAAFMDEWLRLLRAAKASDREAGRVASLRLGYLTGEEDEVMLNAHLTSVALLATPFRADTPQPFAFGPGTRWAEITKEIRAQIPVMVQHRLTPPPRETYSLNRKLSGAFLLASRLGARVNCRRLWEEVTGKYVFRT